MVWADSIELVNINLQNCANEEAVVGVAVWVPVSVIDPPKATRKVSMHRIEVGLGGGGLGG
jgi:hypothetical protein